METKPSIRFTRIPQANDGGAGEHDFISGSVTGAQEGQQVVLFAKSGRWWLQPSLTTPFTRVQPNSTWVNSTHLGTDYAALLVDPGYAPPASLDRLPSTEGLVKAVEITAGQKTPPSPILTFSGYDWIVRDAPSNRGGTFNLYNPANAFTDASGALHLRISKNSEQWTCAEVSLTRSLGYGTYLFTVRDTSGIDPAAVFGMFTWDWGRPEQNFSEADIEISRWGDQANKNTQYVIQPYHIPANVFRFSTPPGALQHSLRWESGRLSFSTMLRDSGRVVGHHDFTSAVPSPGLESIRMNLYPYHGGKAPPGSGAEVVVEKFEYLP